MTRLFRSLCGSASCQVLIGVAGLLFATRPAESQSEPARVIVSCPPGNQSAAFKPFSTMYSRGESVQTDAVVSTVSTVIQEVQRTSFPELAHVDLRVRIFRSHADYFRTRFSFSRFLLFMPMQYFTDVNPALFQEQAPSDGVCAILAHELVHIASLSRGNRVRRFSLVRLLSKRQTAKFERRTDLEAIHRGYGDGLKSYREWVYAHIPSDKLPEKRRNYFSPEEIGAIQIFLEKQPKLFEFWRAHVPMSLREIQKN